jgi:hypothetical protein
VSGHNRNHGAALLTVANKLLLGRLINGLAQLSEPRDVDVRELIVELLGFHGETLCNTHSSGDA